MILALLLSFVCQATEPASNEQAFFQDLEQVRSSSLTLQSEKSRLDALQSALFSKKMSWTPSVSTMIGKTDYEFTPGLDQGYWQANLTWNLLSGGADYHLYRAADANRDAQTTNLIAQALKLESQAADLVFRYIYSLDVLKFTRELVHLREESHRIVLQKYKAGQLPLQEAAKSEIDKSQQETRLRTLEADNLQIQSQWKALLNEPIHTSSWPFSPDTLIADTPSQLSPATKHLELLATAAESTWKASKSRFWPTLDFTASYSEVPIRNPIEKQWSTTISLTLPLWTQYQTTAASASALADLNVARNDYEFARRSENAQREVLLRRLEIHRKNLVDAKMNLEKSEKLYRDMLKSFRYGRLSVNDLLTEQDRFIRSEINLTESELAFHKMLMESCSISGLPIAQCLRQ